MLKFILLYWGTCFLMHLSSVYYPVKSTIRGHQASRYHFLRDRSDIFTLIAIFWLSAFIFLRESYNDTSTYIHSFLHAETVLEGIENGTFTNWTDNPWSMLYRSVMHDLTDNHHIYFFFPAILVCFSVVKLFKRYSVNPALSLLIFFSVGTYVMYMAALKQCLAMFCLLLALPYAMERKYVRFYLLVLAAIMFHTHAFMFAIVPLLLEKPWSKTTWIILGVVLFSMATYKVTLGTFMEYAQSLGALVAEDEVFDGHQINVLRVLVYWVPAMLALFYRKQLFHDSNTSENLFANMSIMSAFILMIGLVEGANLYARMAGYFEIGTAVALPWMINKLFTKQSAHFVTVMATILYFGYFIFEFAITKDFGNSYSAITLWQFIQSLFR